MKTVILFVTLSIIIFSGFTCSKNEAVTSKENQPTQTVENSMNEQTESSVETAQPETQDSSEVRE